jgi:phosphatidylserine/phosphatidylglycerophosphate/cardiolipin synthase-like enzyme
LKKGDTAKAREYYKRTLQKDSQNGILIQSPELAAQLASVFDQVTTTLIEDLQLRGLWDDTLLICTGEFGRTPKIGTQDSTDGRDHWPVVMSMNGLPLASLW